mmetsp:Transcript_119876/g.382690  ORF Transcript_119876/g.382690 Transcript_119876/m.382690 type:complete len:217 (-) Transcript_119876:105-755(-)
MSLRIFGLPFESQGRGLPLPRFTSALKTGNMISMATVSVSAYSAWVSMFARGRSWPTLVSSWQMEVRIFTVRRLVTTFRRGCSPELVWTEPLEEAGGMGSVVASEDSRTAAFGECSWQATVCLSSAWLTAAITIWASFLPLIPGRSLTTVARHRLASLDPDLGIAQCLQLPQMFHMDYFGNPSTPATRTCSSTRRSFVFVLYYWWPPSRFGQHLCR